MPRPAFSFVVVLSGCRSDRETRSQQKHTNAATHYHSSVTDHGSTTIRPVTVLLTLIVETSSETLGIIQDDECANDTPMTVEMQKQALLIEGTIQPRFRIGYVTHAAKHGHYEPC